MRGVGGVRKSIHQSWLAKGLGLGLLCLGFKGIQKEIPSKEASTLQIGSVAFSTRDNAPVHNFILITDYLTKIGINTVHHRPYSRDLAPCDFLLFPKLAGCRFDDNWGDESSCDKPCDYLNCQIKDCSATRIQSSSIPNHHPRSPRSLIVGKDLNSLLRCNQTCKKLGKWRRLIMWILKGFFDRTGNLFQKFIFSKT